MNSLGAETERGGALSKVACLALVIASILAYPAGVAHADVVTFFDSFNRPNGAVGNGWSNASGNVNGDLFISGGALTSPPGEGRGGIFRPINLSAPVTVSATITDQNGFAGVRGQYDTTMLFGSNGQTNNGYGLLFVRSDAGVNNSAVKLLYNNNVIGSAFSTFQFGSSITPTFTFNPNGSITGSVLSGGSTFNFDFGARPVTLNGSNFGINLEYPDSRFGVVTVSQRVDDLSISYSTNATPLPTPTPHSLTVSSFLETVASSGNQQASAGAALGNAINYYREDVYRSQQAAIEDCIFNNNPPGCDIDKLGMQQRQGYAQFAKDVGTVGVEINNSLQGKAIGTAAVDTSVLDNTLLFKLKSVVDIFSDIKSFLQNAIDLRKSLFSNPLPMSLQATTLNAPEPIIFNSISGRMYWDNDGHTSWLLSDLQMNVDISKDYFPDIASGQLFGTVDSLYPGATGFGVFEVTDVVDPPGYNTVNLSFRHIDYIGSDVPEPAPIALVVLGLVGLRLFRRKGRAVRPI